MVYLITYSPFEEHYEKYCYLNLKSIYSQILFVQEMVTCIVFVLCCVGSGHCYHELFTGAEDCYRVCECLSVSELETSNIRRPRPGLSHAVLYKGTLHINNTNILYRTSRQFCDRYTNCKFNGQV